MAQHDSLTEKSALVTGGTGSIGAAIVRALVDRGVSDLWFQYCANEEAAKELEAGTGATGFALDLATAFQLPRRDFHILVNSAGILLRKTLAHEVSDDELTKTIDVNLLAPFRASQQCIPYMMSEGFGRIVNIGSIYAKRGGSDNSPYNVSKHGLLGVTRSLAKEYARYGIAVNEVDPSAVEGDMMRRIAVSNVQRGTAESVEGYLDEMRQAIPAGRMPTPEVIAQTVVFLIAQDGLVNGVSLPVDGGMIC